MEKIKNQTLMRVQKVRNSLATQRLSVGAFTSLHGELISIVSPLLENEYVTPAVMKYIQVAEQLTTYTYLATSTKSSYEKAQTALKECKEELGILIPIVKKAQKSKSATIQPVAQKIYELYSNSIKGRRLSVTNAYGILSPFIRDVKAMNAADVKAAGYSESITYISGRFDAFNTATTAITVDETTRQTAQKNLMKVRGEVESFFQVLMMSLFSCEVMTGDGTFQKVLNEIMYKVSHVKTVEKSKSTRIANNNAAAAEGAGSKDDESSKLPGKEDFQDPAAEGNKPEVVETGKPKEGTETPEDEIPNGGETGDEASNGKEDSTNPASPDASPKAGGDADDGSGKQ